ncbi:hypothetical protein ACLUEY_08940 [Vreelandella aquamarina]
MQWKGIGSTLVASSFFALALPAVALDWQETPTYGTVDLTSGFLPDPHVTALVAGGSHSASEAGAGCRGYVSDAPDLDLNYQSGNHSLSIYAESQQDITLVVFDAQGNWHCNDDTSGTNPVLQWQNPPSGNYNIWVGNYSSSGNYPEATLSISEGAPRWGNTVPANTSSSATGADGIEWGDNTSRWANDGECDDPRFGGPGVHSINIPEDRFHDAHDCRTLYEQGQIFLE